MQRGASDVCSFQELDQSTSSNKEQFKYGCSKEESHNTTCTRNNGDKNCQAEKSAYYVAKEAPKWICSQRDQQC